MKWIGIVGSRRRDTWADYKAVEAEFLRVYQEGDYIVSGGCGRGGDKFAEQIARRLEIPILILYARWKKEGRRVAGFKRNTEVARRADVLIACVAQDRTGGTEDTIEKFTQVFQKTDLVLC